MVVEFVVGAAVGGFGGYYLGQYLAYKKADLGDRLDVVKQMTANIAEMKAKFDQYEKLSAQKEKYEDKITKEREDKYKQFQDATSNFFKTQEQLRIEAEQKRDKQVEGFASTISAFNKTIMGTKTRGNLGEDILKSYLREAIKSKLVKSPLNTSIGPVEFGWSLFDGKYIPIDAKFPDVIDLIKRVDEENVSQAEKNKIRQEISRKVAKQISEVCKYQNQQNTVNKCLLVVPDGIIEICPELIDSGVNQNVFVCTPSQVFFLAYMIAEDYNKNLKEGTVGELKEKNKTLINILKEISGLSETIDKQANSVIKHNDLVKDNVQKALRL